MYVPLNESLTGLWKFSNNRIRIYVVTAALNRRVPGDTMAFYFRQASKENTGEEKVHARFVQNIFLFKTSKNRVSFSFW